MNVLSSQENRTEAKGKPVVSLSGLTKTYKGGHKALQGLDLEIEKGDLFGIVGPDGAGKTTALNIICGIMKSSSGKILIDGKAPNLVREQIGYVPQNGALYPELTIEESLRYEAGLHSVSAEDYEQRRDLYLKKMGLDKFADRLTSQLSGGMKQKLALCCALISEPKLLVLDEPTNGLDPISRRELWQTLSELTQAGVTAIVATPFLDEAERCSRVALLYEGKVHECGSPKELKKALNLSRLDIEIEIDIENNGEKTESSSATFASLAQATEALRKSDSENLVDIFTYGDHVEVLTRDFERARQEVSEGLQKEGFKISHARQTEPSMENVFVMRLRELGVKEVPPKPFPSESRESQSKNSSGDSKNNGAAISARGLQKRFDNFQAVKNFDLELPYGEIYGLLGANGAGKTTTIKMLCGLLAPTAGQVSLAGETGDLRSRKVRKKIGYMSQKFTLYDALTVQENLEFYASIYEIPKAERQKRLDWAIEACNLADMRKSIVGPLPRGWKQRVAFGAAVLHEPEILFLDEPTAGVDPIARRQIWSLVRELAKKGTAVLVTTHYLDEAEYCTRMSLMANSSVVAQGSPREIKAQTQGKLFEVRSDNTQKTFLELSKEFEPWRVSIFGSSIHLLVDSEADLAKVQDVPKDQIKPIPFTLEDAFIAVVQQSRNQDADGNNEKGAK
ncbi:MAG: ABC transporter ATP-binding protein [Cyanobacteria bacterium REEB67]|nr:ABC transporter ATP-binding protein [Cyanobacteria bacterium REEB67]